MMVKIEGFPLLGICAVPKLHILLTTIGRSMLDHELNISRTGQYTLQAIDHQ
jgi:hypothetical protein